MPRKQNGWGNSKSFAFKDYGRVDIGKGKGAPGTYPRNRQYGASVHRTVKEHWNLNSDWVSWRKGYELYNVAGYSLLRVENPDYNSGLPIDENNLEYIIAELKSVLYQGTAYEIETLFNAFEFPTMASDNNTHYAVKRSVSTDSNLGVINQVFSDDLLYPEQKKYKEIWCKGVADTARGRLLLQMINERLTDGETEATLKNLLTSDNKPAIYLGKTPPATAPEAEEFDFQQTQVKVSVPISNVDITENQPGTYVINQGLSTYKQTVKSLDILNDPQQLVGKIIYIPNFFIEKSISNIDEINWVDGRDYFATYVQDSESGQDIIGLDPGVSTLPPSMYDISELPKIFTATGATYEISGTYVFQKSDYQRFFGKQYLTADLVKDQVTDASYSVLPFVVLGASVENNELKIISEPFKSEIKFYPPLLGNSTLIFNDKSFCKYRVNQNNRFDYELNTDVDPWQDEVFTSGNNLKPADVYTCSCPSYAKSIITAPQATQDYNQRKANRQLRYPLPTALSSNRFEGIGTDAAAGKISSWETQADREGFKLCKHTIAARFIDNIKVLEPNEYPTVEARVQFEQKLEKDMNNLDRDFRLSFQRSGISLAEIVFSIAQGLNLDDIETAYVMLNSNF
jgi:hypothetical protein